MNVLVLTTSYPESAESSSGLFIHELAKALRRRGHEIRVIVPGRAGCVGRCTLDGIRINRFGYSVFNRRHRLTSVPGGIPEALRRSPVAWAEVPLMVGRFVAEATLNASWATVLYANWLGAGLAGSAAHLLTGRPMVLTLRGDDAYLAHSQRFWRVVARWVFRHCGTVTAVSPNMVPLMTPHLPPRLRPVRVPTFGVNTERFRPAAPRTPCVGRLPGGLYVGNLTHAKGVDVLIRALAQCRNDWARFTLVGEGSDEDAMRRLAGEHGIADRLDWLGRKTNAAIATLMQQADFLVLASRSEGRPNVVIEALASGLPPIATRVGGTPQLVRHGETGLLVPSDDVAGLAEAIHRLCRDPGLRETMARTARRFVEQENLTWDRTAAEFETIFRDTAGRGAPRPAGHP